MWLLHGRVARARRLEIHFGRGADRLVAVQDRHQRRLAFGFVRHDAVAQPLHHALHVLLQAQLARVRSPLKFTLRRTYSSTYRNTCGNNWWRDWRRSTRRRLSVAASAPAPSTRPRSAGRSGTRSSEVRVGVVLLAVLLRRTGTARCVSAGLPSWYPTVGRTNVAVGSRFGSITSGSSSLTSQRIRFLLQREGVALHHREPHLHRLALRQRAHVVLRLVLRRGSLRRAALERDHRRTGCRTRPRTPR